MALCNSPLNIRKFAQVLIVAADAIVLLTINYNNICLSRRLRDQISSLLFRARTTDNSHRETARGQSDITFKTLIFPSAIRREKWLDDQAVVKPHHIEANFRM